jgi:hypothetical protein
VWKCVSAEEECPKARPHVGAPCVRPMTCDYGSCLFEGNAMECELGFWETSSVSCDDRARDAGRD